MKKFLLLIAVFVLFFNTANVSFAESRMESTNRFVSFGKESGLIGKISVDEVAIYVDEGLWDLLNIDQKSQAASVYAEYFKLRYKHNWVFIKSYYSGRKIGKYDQAWGYKNY